MSPTRTSRRTARLALAQLVLLCCGSGCASAPAKPVAAHSASPAAAAPAPAASAGAEGDTLDPAPSLEVVGRWAQFWAPAGHAETQRYVFFDDGRYGWVSAGGAEEHVGRYRLEDSTLVLQVEHGTGGASGAAPRAQRRLELGACPPNDEAHALDQGYRCLSIGGDAFFRRGDVTPADRARFTH